MVLFHSFPRQKFSAFLFFRSKNRSPILFLKYSSFLAAFFYKNVAFRVHSSMKILKSELRKLGF